MASSNPTPNPQLQQMVADPDFLGLSPADKRDTLAKATGDQDFAKLSDGDTIDLVGRMNPRSLAPPIPKPTMPQMQPSNLGIAMGSDNSGVANPQQPAEQFAIQNPGQQGKLATAATIGASGTAAVAGLPAAINAGATTALPYAIKVGQWAKRNKLEAMIALDILKDVVPGFKKATELIKKAP